MERHWHDVLEWRQVGWDPAASCWKWENRGEGTHQKATRTEAVGGGSGLPCMPTSNL